MTIQIVSFSCTAFVGNIFRSHKYLASYIREVLKHVQSDRYYSPILTKFGMCPYILVQLSCVRVYKDMFSDSRCTMPTDGQMSVAAFMQLLVANCPDSYNTDHNKTNDSFKWLWFRLETLLSLSVKKDRHPVSSWPMSHVCPSQFTNTHEM